MSALSRGHNTKAIDIHSERETAIETERDSELMSRLCIYAYIYSVYIWYKTVQSHSDNIELAPKYVKSVLKNSWPDIVIYIYMYVQRQLQRRQRSWQWLAVK